MTVYACLRVSTDKQDHDNQKHGVLDYANRQRLGPMVFIEDTASGRKPWRERGVGDLLMNTASQGDVVVFAEISRMARSTLQVLEMLEHCCERGIVVHIAKQNMILDDSLPSQITATVLGLAAQIDREFISMRTTEALASRRQQIEDKGYFLNKDGEKRTALGRPKGRKADQLALDEHREAIEGFLAKGVGMTATAKIVGCAKSTLYDYCKRRGIKRPA